MSLAKRLFLLLFIAGMAALAPAQPLSDAAMDSLVGLTLRTFNVPGIAVAIVKDGRVAFARGYGVRSIASGQKMDEHTLAAIASNSKAFTAAALGMLIDDGKLTWDTHVTDIIPEFRLHDPWVTAEFTVRDLLCHRSGLGLGAGDLMLWPDSTAFTRAEIIHNLRYLQPVSSFRTRYDYDNLLYIVAGEVVARVAGISWEEFVETRIMQPLGMRRSAASFNRIKDRANVIDPHAVVDGKLQVVTRESGEAANAAGGLYSSVSDLAKWVLLQINGGRYGDKLEQRLFSAAVHAEMWTPQTIIPVRGAAPYHTHFLSYGLGWTLRDVEGRLQASHTGSLMGMVSEVTILPELQLGIIVLTNQQEGAAFRAIANTIKDHYLGLARTDRVQELAARAEQGKSAVDSVTAAVDLRINQQLANPAAIPERAAFAGTYRDAWFGEVSIAWDGQALRFQAKKSPKLRGEIFHYAGGTFVVRWQDRSFEADAFLLFDLDIEGKPQSFTMKAVSPATDFSFDFQDLKLVRVSD